MSPMIDMDSHELQFQGLSAWTITLFAMWQTEGSKPGVECSRESSLVITLGQSERIVTSNVVAASCSFESSSSIERSHFLPLSRAGKGPG